MPRFVKKLSAEDYRRRGGGTTKLNLAPYLEILEGLSVGEGADVAIDDGEKQRVVKRRFSIAAGQLGYSIKWRSAAQGQLRFQLAPRKAAS